MSITQVNDAAYVYDANLTGVSDPGPTNDSRGGWRTTVGGLYGDLTGGGIAPGQGFFVQTASGASSPSLTFSESDQLNDGPFYGKQTEPTLSSLGEGGPHDFVRLELEGETGYNSVWIRFSEDGSLEPTSGEALELQPLSNQYALLGARKADGGLMDIAHFPLDADNLEIPLAVQATRSGSYTLRATDLDLPTDMALYLHDRQSGESVPISDESFEYSFMIDEQLKTIPPYQGGTKRGVLPLTPQAQKTTSADRSSAQASRSTVISGPSKAVTDGTDRFVITTSPGAQASELPDEVALGQNYPNPFNPVTVISYQLPANSKVRLEVYDMLGRRVAMLVDGQVTAGTHQVNFDAGNLSSGIYLYRLTAHGPGGNQIFSRKLTLIK